MTGAAAEVVFPLPVFQHFDYLIPAEFAGRLQPGHRVLVPFGKRRPQIGIVTKISSQIPQGPFTLKPLIGIMEDPPAMTEADIELGRWMSRRYFCSLGEGIFAACAVGQKRPPKFERAGKPAPVVPSHVSGEKPAALTEHQSIVIPKILDAVRGKRFEPFLLHGVAAAGKTEVYLRCIEACLAEGRAAIYLVPEIGLTPQTESILKTRFGSAGVEAWHSQMPQGEKWRIWNRVRSGRSRVVLGPRSALFLSPPNLGLIAMDEEHDASYKEDSRPSYHAREVAIQKARLHNVPVVMGSATPSLESHVKIERREVTLLDMPRRVGDIPFPDVKIVNMTGKIRQIFSEPFLAALAACLDRKEQALVFLNRRGFATHVLCQSCGWQAVCPRCQTGLVFHKKDSPQGADDGRLRCHLCGYEEPWPKMCPKCHSPTIRFRGKGTQRVVEHLEQLFPQARVFRWDKDATQKRHGHAEAFGAVSSENVDIVVGTRMVSQGLHFPRMTLVGVLEADRGLLFPDFRAGERTFQLLTQVAGRAGRADKPGEVYFQARHADHYSIAAASRFDYKTFVEQELAYRREMGYPPFTRLIQIRLRGKTAPKVEQAAESLMRWAESQTWPSVERLGPAPCFHVREAGDTQWQVILKGPEAAMAAVQEDLHGYKPPSGVTAHVDVDPEDLL